MVIPFSTISKVHAQSDMMQSKIPKDVMVEWQFDFMIEISSQGSSENKKSRKMVLLANSEQLYLQFLQGLTQAVIKEEGTSSANSQATVTPPQTLSNQANNGA